MDMFRQIAPHGVVKKEAVDKNLSPGDALDSEEKVEIDQTPRPLEGTFNGTLPDRSVDAQKLAEEAGCPFAGTDPTKAAAPFPPVADVSSNGTSDKIAHPNLPLSDSTKEVLASGEQEGVCQCPFISTASK